MKKHFKNLIVTVCLLTLAVSFSSCKLKSGLDSPIESEKIQAMGQLILDKLTTDDKEGFQDLFCQKIKKSEGFSEKTDEVFALFKCDSFVRANINNTAGGGKSWGESGVDSWNVFPEIHFIETVVDDEDSAIYGRERFYDIYYAWQIVDLEHKDEEGLQSFRLEFLNHDEMVEIRMPQEETA